ncbi:MAG: DUF3857 domain-containing protein [Candidatus Omnitrophica bacterium]|nr:DUF3857 domain-containing protein [Candidatus Omnitrophota bacterium]
MREVLFSAGSVLVFILVCCVIAFNPITTRAQMELAQAEAPPQSPLSPHPMQPQKLPLEIVPPSSTTQETTVVATSPFEATHSDKESITLLYDLDVEVHEDFSYTATRRIRRKILKDSARYLGEIPIPYTKGKEEVTNIDAYTITPDGKKHRYSKIQDIAIYEEYGMYSDARVKVITLPEVNVGSVIVCEFTIETKQGSIKNAFWKELYLDCYTPTKVQDFTYTFPKSLDIQYKEYNLEFKPTITEDKDTITYSWHTEDLFNERSTETYAPPLTFENIPNIVQFSSMKDWSEVSDWYHTAIKKNLKITPEIEEAAKEASKDTLSVKETVRHVLEYIQDNFRYVSMSFGDNALEPHPTDEIFKNKYGDCKDLSLLCMALLKVKGIESHLAFFNTEDSITDPQHDLPMPIFFNHVVLLIRDPKEGDYYVDTLLKGYDIGEFPKYYQLAYTFVVTEDGGFFKRLPMFDSDRTYTKKEYTFSIEADGSGTREVESLWPLNTSIDVRSRMKKLSDEDKKKLFESLDAQQGAGGEFLERSYERLSDKYGRLKSYSKIFKRQLFPVTDGMMIMEIGGYTRPDDFTEKERTRPIFFPGNILTETIIRYNIPKGFGVSHMPKDIDIDIGFFAVYREYRKKGNAITVIKREFYRRRELPAEDYPRVKAFFDELPQKTEQRIILKKKKSLWERLSSLRGTK